MVESNKINICVDYVLEILLGPEFKLCAKKYIAYSAPENKTADDARLYIVPSGLFGGDYGKQTTLPSLPLKEIDGIPLLYGLPKVRREGDRMIVNADIIASTYFLVTRYEEMIRRDVRDEHGRFPGRQSLPYRAGFIQRPIVDEYAELLRKWLQEVGVNVPQTRRRFNIILTHDVDEMRKYKRLLPRLRLVASILLGRSSPRRISEHLAVSFGFRKDPLNNVDEIINLDTSVQKETDSFPIEVVYFFMSGGKSQFDGIYNIHSKIARDMIETVCESGAKIGLHTSYEAGMHPELIAKEKETLEKICGFPVYRNRHHFLSWREIEDGRVLSQAGITWDSTLGYADVAGFRLGVCRPIPLFDPINMQQLDIEEHPLIVMDCTLNRDDYMNLTEDEAYDYCKGLIDQTYRHNGEFVMLWHNVTLIAAENNYHPRLYRRLLNELSREPILLSRNC